MHGLLKSFANNALGLGRELVVDEGEEGLDDGDGDGDGREGVRGCASAFLGGGKIMSLSLSLSLSSS